MKAYFILKATKLYSWVCDILVTLPLCLLLSLNGPQWAQAQPQPGDLRIKDYIAIDKSEKISYEESLGLLDSASIIMKSLAPG